MSELKMTREQFKFIWRHFHVQTPENVLESLQEESKDDILDDSSYEGDENDSRYLVEQNMERLQQDQEEKLSESDIEIDKVDNTEKEAKRVV